MKHFNKIASFCLLVLVLVFVDETYRQHVMDEKVLKNAYVAKQLVDISPTNDVEEHIANNIVVLTREKLDTIDKKIDIVNIRELSFVGKENDGYTYLFHLTMNKNGKFFNSCTAEITFVPLNDVYDLYIPLNCYSF